MEPRAAGGGRDVMDAGGGRDVMDAGDGRDVMDAGGGRDVMGTGDGPSATDDRLRIVRRGAAWLAVVIAGALGLWAPTHSAVADTTGRQPASLAESGAAGDGKTDDTAAVNKYLASLHNGAVVTVPAGHFYRIASGDLVVPAGIRLTGEASPFGSPDASPFERSEGFTIAVPHTVELRRGAQLENLSVLRDGLLPNPTPAQVMAAVKQWGTEHSAGVTLPQNIGGQTLRGLFIEGFNTCIRAYVGRFSIQRVEGDCYNGVDTSAGGDNYYIDDVRFEPFYALRTRVTTGAWARPGIAFNLHDGNTGSVLTRVFSFMWANGLVFNNTGVAQVANSGFEWQSSIGNGITGAVGVRWINHDSETSTDDVYLNGFDTSFSDEGVGEVMIRAAAVGNSTVAAFNLGGTTAKPTTITLNGNVAPGAAVSASVAGAGIPGSPVSVDYSVVPGDTRERVALALAQAIDARQVLIAARVAAAVRGNVVTIYWPQTSAVAVTARASGGLAVAIGTGAAQPGSYGAIIAPNIGWGPAFRVGPLVSHWNIVAPYLGNAQLPKDWLSIDPSSIDRVWLSGIPWSHGVDYGHLSECGRIPAIAPHSGDTHGSLTEGEGATGCTVTFVTPFPTPPTCVVSSPDGAPLTGYVASTTALTIVNPVHQRARYNYICSP
ncbi:MAG TPA: glycosyl hydrolase family 28-related protein [Acetobacteraceae bacterium]|nr:glycosyl hydrolase family 28-related protein [Acetobacteraceae bacterium]